MAKAKRKSFEAELIDFLINEYYQNDAKKFAEQVLCTGTQIQAWRDGVRRPQRSTIRLMLAQTFVPEIRVIAEFMRVKLNRAEDIAPSMHSVLKRHEDKVGVYAFYDSL